MDMLLDLVGFVLAFIAIGLVFYALFLPLFCAIFHDGVSSALKIKVGANGKKPGSIYSAEYSVSLIESIAKNDPRFSDILMRRMGIEDAERQIRIAKRKKHYWKIKDLENQIWVTKGHLEDTMVAYIQENPSTYNNPAK